MPYSGAVDHVVSFRLEHVDEYHARPAVRRPRRLLDELDWVDASPGGAGCVNGTRLLADRGPIADAPGFRGVIPHTRDAMWQVDGLVRILATAVSLLGRSDVPEG